jgi:hypothetical protein
MINESNAFNNTSSKSTGVQLVLTDNKITIYAVGLSRNIVESLLAKYNVVVLKFNNTPSNNSIDIVMSISQGKIIPSLMSDLTKASIDKRV